MTERRMSKKKAVVTFNVGELAPFASIIGQLCARKPNFGACLAAFPAPEKPLSSRVVTPA